MAMGTLTTLHKLAGCGHSCTGNVSCACLFLQEQ